MWVGRADLIKDGQITWYKTKAGTPDAQFEIQGNLFFWPLARGAGAASVQAFEVTVEYECEFQTYVPITSTPFVRLLHLPTDVKRSLVTVLDGNSYLKLTSDMLQALKLDNPQVSKNEAFVMV